jgi:hypothetical protein
LQAQMAGLQLRVRQQRHIHPPHLRTLLRRTSTTGA